MENVKKVTSQIVMLLQIIKIGLQNWYQIKPKTNDRPFYTILTCQKFVLNLKKVQRKYKAKEQWDLCKIGQMKAQNVTMPVYINIPIALCAENSSWRL